jgi:hypothetical protein
MNASNYVPLGAIVIVVMLAIRSRKRVGKTDHQKSEVRTAADIDSEIAKAQEYVEFFSNYKAQHDEALDPSFVAKAGEEVLAKVVGVALIETKRGPSTFTGGSTGISFRVTKRVSLRQSGIRGRSIPGEEAPSVSDQGEFVITDQRGVFIGTKQTREFLWSKLLSYQLVPLGGNMIMYLPVSNRAKVSGIGGDEQSMDDVMKRVAFGVSIATGRSEQFISGLRTQIEQLKEERASFGSN